jgi:hypothetical protein
MKRRSSLKAGLALLLTAALYGCGSGGGGSSVNPGGGDPGTGPGSTGGGTSVTNTDRMAAINAAESKWQNLLDNVPNRDARHQQMVDFMKTQTAVKTAGISQFGDVWVQFKDNQYHLILDGDVPTVDATPVTPLRSPSRSVRTNVATRATRAQGSGDMPDNKKARVYQGMGPGFPTTDDKIIDMLFDRGYDVTQRRATIENMRTVSGDGVFFIYTHGGLGQDATTGATWWTLWTDTVVSDANNELYKDDIKDGSLVTATAIADVVNGKWISGTHYMITGNFIKKYNWGFAKNSVVFLNSCYSAASGATSTMRSLAQPAEQTFGWSETMRTDKGELSAQFIFDRMLGANKLIPEVPAQRPFNGTEAYDNAGLRNFADGSTMLDATFDAAHPCTLVEKHRSNDIVLAPSIERMEMSERIFESPLKGNSRLTLFGLFGADQDTVKIDGVEVPIISWAKDKVVCEPADVPGSGFSGDVQVISKSRKGNLVPLTQWHGTLTYSIDLLPPQVSDAVSTFKCDVYFRGDVHEYREISRGDRLTKPMAFRVSQGSTCQWTVTGHPPSPGVWNGPTSGSYTFGLNGNVQPPYGTGYIVSGVIDPKAKTVGFSFTFLNGVTSYAFPGTPNSQAVATLRDAKITSTASGVNTNDGYPIYNNNIPATLGDDYVIPGKTLNGTTPIFLPKIVLSDFIPTHQPDPSKGEDDK